MRVFFYAECVEGWGEKFISHWDSYILMTNDSINHWLSVIFNCVFFSCCCSYFQKVPCQVFFLLFKKKSGCWLAVKLKCITMISTRRKAFWNCSNSIAVVIKLMGEESVHSVSSVLFGEFQWNFGRFYFSWTHTLHSVRLFFFCWKKEKSGRKDETICRYI